LSDSPATFTDFGVEAVLADALRAKGIVHPFPIQELTLPMALKGADLIGQARTGTGKTLAFGLPLLQRVDADVPKTQALVIVPTRELCLQVADDLTVGADRGVTSIAIYGGVGYEEQIEALTSGVHVVIGTPGRTLDHLGRGNLDLSHVHTVVLDEADEMLDMGFLPDVERLLTEVPEERQTLLFSATMPAVIVKLARRFMSKPTFMRAEAEERETAPTVDQHFFLVHRMDKPRVLARLLQDEQRGGAFVFTRTKNMADRLVRELEDLRVSAIAVHGDLRQSTREKNLDRFRAGKADVLVATEVAARGLDVDNVTHVVNYDCPDDEKMYLHRIGRTARAGARGVAVTFAEFNEIDRLNVIRKAVDADAEVAEVFSTSDVLTETFDLPEETPWDHLARGGGGGKSSGRSSSGGRRTSSSDGRNKSRRGSDGSRPASRDRGGRGERESSTSSSTSTRTSSTSTRTSSTSTRTSSRTRTRTRTRSRDGGDGGSGSRTRARGARPTSERKGGDGGASNSRSSGRDSTGGSSKDSGAKDGNGATDGSSGRRRAGSSKGRSGNGSNGSSGNGGGSSKKDSSPKGSSSKGSSAKKGNGSKGSSGNGSKGGSSGGRDGGRRPMGGTGGDVVVETTRRGESARGDGTPRPRRRVQVDHLP
jgi:superfamily II DNA/RNA helicase